jgi:diacylglycerol kinase family enzyme
VRALALLGPRGLQMHFREFQDSRAELIALESPKSEDLKQALASSSPDIVLVFGGDGTLNRHLALLVESGVPTLVVPTGSGNDLARANGTPRVVDAVGVWKKFLNGAAEIVSVDLGIIQTQGSGPRYFSCCANIGLDADATRRTDGFPNWIKANGGYFLGGLASMACYQPKMMKISTPEIDGASEAAWFLSISNTPTYGGGLKIAPQASITDGKLDITYAAAKFLDRFDLARHFPKILSGNHVGLPQLTIFCGAQVSVETEFPQPIYADGEYIADTPCTICVSPRALKIVR